MEQIQRVTGNEPGYQEHVQRVHENLQSLAEVGAITVGEQELLLATLIALSPNEFSVLSVAFYGACVEMYAAKETEVTVHIGMMEGGN
jgi:hypothetical protein